MSCEGGDTIRVPMEDVSGPVYSFVSADGATLTMSGGENDMVFRQGGPGFYTVQDTPAADMYGVFYIHGGPTSAYGEVVVGFTDSRAPGLGRSPPRIADRDRLSEAGSLVRFAPILPAPFPQPSWRKGEERVFPASARRGPGQR